MKVKTVIIDDEAISRDTIRSTLTKYCPEIEVTGEAASVADAVECIQTLLPNLIFLDIEIIGGTGFDVLQQIDVNNLDIIFVTGFNQFAIKAFKYSAIDYLLKPVNEVELVQAVNKVIRLDERRILQEKLRLMDFNRQSENKKIALPAQDGLTMVWVNDIVRCESDNSYTSIFCKNKNRYVVSKGIKEYEELFDNRDFFRVHQSHLVNLKYVHKFQKEDGGLLIMEDGARIPVARRRKEKLIELLIG